MPPSATLREVFEGVWGPDADPLDWQHGVQLDKPKHAERGDGRWRARRGERVVAFDCSRFRDSAALAERLDELFG